MVDPHGRSSSNEDLANDENQINDVSQVNESDLIRILNLEWTKNMNFCDYSRELFSYGIYNVTIIDMACIEIKRRHTCTVIEILQKQLKKLAINSFS